ncbi:hypothetical protein [Yoonia sediminilitoris]|uniref:Uncharacterized protein n=1 Tax=Yoonia sediminilitoris TaxID=1286148 RepID=A0A2T6KG37_9RHOB|nr:hypothetical protein [Yoonia sediminilitoris]PUB14287.1 hypothetical protein C8N45_106161 [Yoonia sediminilitoris]RCW95218.1 hypothetical protein DFP92_106161 [Yoonia sediminilitoris]
MLDFGLNQDTMTNVSVGEYVDAAACLDMVWLEVRDDPCLSDAEALVGQMEGATGKSMNFVSSHVQGIAAWRGGELP